MMGTKERRFAPLINVSLEELVPQDHFYRHLDRTLDLTFVREFVTTFQEGQRVYNYHKSKQRRASDEGSSDTIDRLIIILFI